jgi:hypothetical protein
MMREKHTGWEASRQNLDCRLVYFIQNGDPSIEFRVAVPMDLAGHDT